MASVGPVFNTISKKIQQTVSGPTTERLLIIGTAVDGPLNEPVRISSTTMSDRLFGPANYSRGYVDPNTSTESGKPNGASIPLAIQQAIAGGCTDIWVVRATGTFAAAASAFDCLDIKAAYPGRIYNGVSLVATTTGGVLKITLNQPAVKGVSFTSAFASGAPVSDVIDTLNADPRNVTIKINPNTFASTLNSPCLATVGSGTVTLAGGTNGTRARGDDYGPEAVSGVNGMATMLTDIDTGTFASVRNANLKFQVCALTGIYVDDQVVDGGNATTTSIILDFVDFLDQASIDLGPCHGVAAVRPPNLGTDAEIISYVQNNLLATTHGVYNASLRWNKAGPFMFDGFLRSDSVEGRKDSGCRVSVIAGPEAIMRHGDIGNYNDQWHVIYAALLTTIAPERSPQNMSLPGVVGYARPIPMRYCNLLNNGVGWDGISDTSGAGAYVTLVRDRNNYNGPLVIFDDPTASGREDYFRQYQALHLVNRIHNDLDLYLGKFLGGPSNVQALAAMETIVTNILDGYASSGALKGSKGTGYDFQIGMEGNDADLGIVRVTLSLTLARSLRKIFVTLGVSKS